jgi:hypothetical protein
MVFIDVCSGESYDVEAKTKSRAFSGRCSHVIWKKRNCPETPGVPLQLSLKPLLRYKLLI